MKRMLLDSQKVIPITLTDAVDRLGAQSAILAANISTATADAVATVTVLDADIANGTFEPVLDIRLFMNDSIITRDAQGRITQVSSNVPVAAGDLLNVGIDLISCRQYVQFVVSYAGGASPSVSATYAVALGDYNQNPPTE